MASNSAFAINFDEPAFRDAIRQTMRMGMPQNVAERLTWHWKRQKTFTPQDRRRRPYDWTETPVTNEPGTGALPDPGDDIEQSLVVDYALEFQAKQSAEAGTAVGLFNPSRAVVTLMDEDYEQIKDSDYATLAGAIYEIDFTGPPMGLFACTVYQVYLQARDET